jgi:tol-pal system-associated acyl-CoA thioesterase
MSHPLFSLPLRVYIEDTDAGGIVYYVNYLKFMERARTEWLRTFGYQHYTLAEENYLFVVQSANVRYVTPARIDDQLQVEVQLQKLGRASFVFIQRVMRGNELICEADVRVGCIQEKSFKPTSMPDDLYEKIKREMAA